MLGISTAEALDLLRCDDANVPALMTRAHEARLEHRGRTVRLCGVVNAKSGHCPEDCKFCAQSAHNDAPIRCHELHDAERLIEESKAAAQNSASRFGIVTSGTRVSDPAEIETIAQAVAEISKAGRVAPCASLGNVDGQTLIRLKEAGLTRYHNNLETARSFWKEICTTRDWEEAAQTIHTAKRIGLSVCSGGLLGLGETLEQRVEFLDQVRELDVDAVPLNFFVPHAGTKLSEVTPIRALECIRVIAVARLMMPTKEIRICGGRETNMRDLQSWSLIAGADGLMVGGYLTTSGRDVEEDLRMIRDAGFQVEPHESTD